MTFKIGQKVRIKEDGKEDWDRNYRYPGEYEFVVTQVYGSASKPPTDPDNTTAGTGDYFSFYSQGDARISFTMSNKEIVITTTTDMTAYSGFIVITYIREGT